MAPQLFYFVTFGGFVFFANYLPQLLGPSAWRSCSRATTLRSPPLRAEAAV